MLKQLEIPNLTQLVLLKLVRKHLDRKYFNQFDIFRKIPINFILYKYRRSSIIHSYTDAIAYSNESEYLKIICIPSKGKQNILQILQMIRDLAKAEDILQKPKITFEYPTMFVTETYPIFILRFKRRQKQYMIEQTSSSAISISSIKNIEAKHLYTSKQSESPLFNRYLTDSGLEPSKSLISEYMFNLSSLLQYQYNQFCGQLEDIYAPTSQISQNKEPQPDWKCIEQDQMNRLIYDFKEQLQGNRDARQLYQNRMKLLSQYFEQANNIRQLKSSKKITVPKRETQAKTQNVRSVRKQTVREKAKQLLQRIQKQKSFEFSNSKFTRP